MGGRNAAALTQPQAGRPAPAPTGGAGGLDVGTEPSASSVGSSRLRSHQWDDYLGELQDYAAEQGHSSPPAQHITADKVLLGRWVTIQRKAFAQGSLSADRAARLEGLPGWAWSAADGRWEQNFAALSRYITAHDGSYPDRTYLSPTGVRVETWLRHQRLAAANGTLDEQRKRRLESLPGWSSGAVDDGWEQAYAELAAFAEEHGHANPVKGTTTATGLLLGNWVSNQRSTYARGAMVGGHAERIARLEALPGWVWNVHDALWEQGLAELVTFCEQTGSAAPTRSVITSTGYRLGQWVQGQRRRYRLGGLRPDRAARLEALPGWTWRRV